MTNKPNAFVQFLSSERVVGAVLLLIVLIAALAFEPAFRDFQPELQAICAAFIAQFVGLHTYVKVKSGAVVFADSDAKPLIEPLRKLWGSRKFMTTLFGLIFSGAVILIPQLEPMREQILALILLMVTAYNGAIAVEDGTSNAIEEKLRGI